MMRKPVGIIFALLTFGILKESVSALEDVNNEHGLHKISSSMTLKNTRSNSLNSDSTEQLSDDGHDEARRYGLNEQDKQWEASFEMVSNDGVRVTRGQSIEAFWAVLAAVLTAILSNIITRAAVHGLAE